MWSRIIAGLMGVVLVGGFAFAEAAPAARQRRRLLLVASEGFKGDGEVPRGQRGRRRRTLISSGSWSCHIAVGMGEDYV